MTSRAPFHHRGLAAATPTAPQHPTGTGHARPIPCFNRAGGSPLLSKSGRLSRPLKSAAQRGDA